jgi:hypothetical protein
MKIRNLALAVAILSLMLATAWGADITGKWKGSMDMMGQSMELGFVFNVDGSTLTGTSIGPQGNETPISDGKVQGDDISFVVKITGQMEMTINYKGKIVGDDEIKLTMQMDMGGGPGGGGPGGGMGEPPELVLHRAD